MENLPICYPLGDAALLIELGDTIDLDRNRRVHALARQIRQSAFFGLCELVPGYAALTLHYDPARVSYGECVERVLETWARLEVHADEAERLVEIPTRYGGTWGPDLAFVAAQHGLSEAQAVELHAGTEYRVCMLGFTPGFPYLGLVPEEIAAPRLATPRLHVPAGSVAIAGRQTGIYPTSSPGGWRIIGHTDVRLFDVRQTPPTLLSPGDRVRFRVLV